LLEFGRVADEGRERLGFVREESGEEIKRH
jgi:hypothetical protein